MVAVLVLAAPAGATGPTTSARSDSTTSTPTVDKAYALVQLRGAPLSTSSKTRPAQGKKVDFDSASVKSYKALLAAGRNDFKAWLSKAAPRAQVVKGYDLALNAVSVKLNGTSLATIRTSPQVVRAEYQGLYRKTIDDPDLAQISAREGWANAGVSGEDAGEGVKVAVIDSGIDVEHPCFDDAGYPAQAKLGNPAFTNNKVIVAKVFNNKAGSRGYTAEAIDSHGTHVAGTIACNYLTPATVEGADIPFDISGVAPRALLGNYNVFPADVENARSEDILNAMEAAYRDGFDVANMSLGGGASGIQDLLTMAVDNLDRANLVFAVSAGNEGPGHYTVGSPGSAARALTAGAASVAHQVVNPITAGAASAPGMIGDFGIPAYPVTGTLDVLAGDGVSGLNLACAPLAPAPADSIALIQRGVCDFSLKLYYVQQAGYEAAIVVNRVAGAPFTMGTGAAPADPTIPGWMIGLDEAASFKAQDGSPVTVNAPAYVNPFYAPAVMADFSSQGPTDVDFRVKPDVVSPGVNVLSSIPVSDCDDDPCFAFFEGTSMAAPHLAGMAAVVAQQHEDWPAWAIRSAIVNSADVNALYEYDYSGAIETDVNVAGAGKANLANATEAVALLDPVSVSFGSTPAGSGVSKSVAVRLLNADTVSHTWSVGIGANGAAPAGVTFSTSVTSVTLAPGEARTFNVNAVFGKAAPRGDKQAWLTVKDGTTLISHAVVYAFVK